jgi:hypothetical protein
VIPAAKMESLVETLKGGPPMRFEIQCDRPEEPECYDLTYNLRQALIRANWQCRGLCEGSSVTTGLSSALGVVIHVPRPFNPDWQKFGRWFVEAGLSPTFAIDLVDPDVDVRIIVGKAPSAR